MAKDATAAVARFDVDTALTRIDDTTFAGQLDRGWWVYRGPNGGYLAAILLRALVETTADPGRSPRSLAVHYLEAPAQGPVEVTTALERRGASLSTVTARMCQGGRLIAIAVGALSRSREAIEFSDAEMPSVAPPERCALLPVPDAGPPIRDRFESRWALGDPPFSGSRQALAGGWIRLSEPRHLDALVAAALMDAWLPAVYSRERTVLGVPTVDLTVHFRTSLPRRDAAPDDWCLVVFRTRLAAQGFLEEDGELWSRDGQLLAQSRQLGVILAGRD